MYLSKEQRVAAAEFLAGGLWAAMKAALEARRPANSEATDSAETAAHRSFERKGFEGCMESIRALSVETAPEDEPLIPATLTDERD